MQGSARHQRQKGHGPRSNWTKPRPTNTNHLKPCHGMGLYNCTRKSAATVPRHTEVEGERHSPTEPSSAHVHNGQFALISSNGSIRPPNYVLPLERTLPHEDFAVDSVDAGIALAALGEATDPQFGAAWIVVLALCCAVHARAVSRTTLQALIGHIGFGLSLLLVVSSLWSGVPVTICGDGSPPWRCFYPWSVSVKPTQGLGIGCNLRWSLGIALWAFFAPPIVAALKLKGWIPSVDLLFELHAIVLVLWGRVNVRSRWVLLVFALMSWLFDARSATLVASMGWLIFQVEHKATTISFRWATFSTTLLGLTLLLVSPWIQSRWTYDHCL